jgi:hypothetical protein
MRGENESWKRGETKKEGNEQYYRNKMKGKRRQETKLETDEGKRQICMK